MAARAAFSRISLPCLREARHPRMRFPAKRVIRPVRGLAEFRSLVCAKRANRKTGFLRSAPSAKAVSCEARHPRKRLPAKRAIRKSGFLRSAPSARAVSCEARHPRKRLPAKRAIRSCGVSARLSYINSMIQSPIVKLLLKLPQVNVTLFAFNS